MTTGYYKVEGEGVKHDDDKLRYDLIPAYPLERLAEVYTIGAKKYDDRNWEKGFVWGRIFAAMMRHAWAWWRRRKKDPVDGQYHLSSVAWCAFALMEFEHTGRGHDDRPHSNATKMEGCEFVSTENTQIKT